MIRVPMFLSEIKTLLKNRTFKSRDILNSNDYPPKSSQSD